jgi:hypothetical protein
MPRFKDIYGSFSDRKRCRFDRPGVMCENVYVDVGTNEVTREKIRTDDLYTCQFFLIDGCLNDVPFGYLDHYQCVIDLRKTLSHHLLSLLKTLAKNLKNKCSDKLSSEEINIEMFSDLRLMAGGGTVNDKNIERNALSLLIQPSEHVKHQLVSMITDDDCLYLFHQLVNRTVIIKPVVYETSDETEEAVAKGKLFSKNIC